MKLRSILFAAVGLLGLAVGCTEKEGTPAVKLETKEVTVPVGGLAVHLSFMSAASWEIKDISDEWLTVSPASGKGSSLSQTISISAEANDAGFERSATFVIWSASYAKKTVTVYQEGGKTATIALVLEEQDPDTVYPLTGVIGDIARSEKYYGFTLKDATGTIACPFPKNWSDFSAYLHTGDEVSLSGAYSYYESKSEHQIKNAVIKSHTPAVGDAVKASTVADFISKADKFARYRLVGKVSNLKTGTYTSFNLEDETGTILVYTINNYDKFSDQVKNGGIVTLIGAYTYYETNKAHEVVDADIESFEEIPLEKVTAQGVVVATTKAAFIIKTSDGYAYAFNDKAERTVQLGDEVKVEGELTEYYGLDEIINFTVTVLSSNNPIARPEPTVLDANALDKLSTPYSYVKFRGKLTIDSEKGYYNLAVPGADRIGSIDRPENVDATLNGKYVDVTGYFTVITGSKYLNVVETEIKLSDDQSDPESDPEASNSLDAQAGEVKYALTSDEIIAAYTAAKRTSAAYVDFTFASEDGDWTGLVYAFKPNDKTYIQIRSKENSRLTSPTYSTNVKRVVISVNSLTGETDFYAIPVGTDLNASSYTKDHVANKYGHVKCESSKTQDVAMAFTSDTKQFTLITKGKSAYIDAIYVFCAAE